MNVLIISGTGTVGKKVQQKMAVHNGLKFKVATRTANLPNEVSFDWQEEKTIIESLKGIEKLVLITPASPTEGEDGVRLVHAAEKAGVKHVVFMSIHSVGKAPVIPHFKSKIDIQNALIKSRMLWTTIAPNNFFQNDLWFKDALDAGIYPQPFGDRGLSRVDVDDIAEAITNAVLDEKLAGKIYPLVGPQILTATETARVFSEQLNREIRYAGNDLESWEIEMKKFLPQWLVLDWKEMYAFFQKEGLKATAEDLIMQEKILKRPPNCFENFIKNNIQSFT